MRQEDRWKHETVEFDLMKLRLLARHEGGELTPDFIQIWLEDNRHLTEQAVRQAFAEGLAERSTGMRCLCRQCELDVQRIQRHEQLRGEYGRRRWDELRAAGIDDLEIQRRIDIEIANGAALNGTTHQEAGR